MQNNMAALLVLEALLCPKFGMNERQTDLLP